MRHLSTALSKYAEYALLEYSLIILQPIPNADFIIQVEIDNQVHQVYVLKRPGVDQFLRSMAEKFELVVFTASLAKV